MQTVCTSGPGRDIRSVSVRVMTWLWSDVNNDGAADFNDLQLIIDAPEGTFHGDAIPENFDLSPCLPDGIIDDADVASVKAAVRGNPFSCKAPCPAGPNLETLAEFEVCMDGPGVEAAAGCESFDSDVDGNVDLADFADFQSAFVGP